MSQNMTDAEVVEYLAQHVMHAPVIRDDEPYPRIRETGEPIVPVIVQWKNARQIQGAGYNRTWNPTENRNDLAQVLAKVPEGLQKKVARIVWELDEAFGKAMWFLLTAPPSIVSRAVVQAIQESEASK